VSSRSQGLAYQPAIDGLRAVAVLAVLAYHARFDWAVGGWLGVSTFFTLSGFLITSLLFEDRRAGRPLGHFWARRARRLLPASWLALALVLVYGATVADAGQLAQLRGDVIAALAYVANWHFLIDGASYADQFRSPSPVLHFWSLAIEEQFYVVYPLVMAGLLAVSARLRAGRASLAGILALGAALSTAWMVVLGTSGAETDRLYLSTDTRMAELLTGAALGALLSRRPTLPEGGTRRAVGWAGLGALLVLVGLYATTGIAERWVYRGGLQVVALLGGLVVVAAIQPDSPVRRVLAVEPLRQLGLISYGVYLFHFPIFLWLEGEGWSSGAVFVVGGSLTVALALASYRLVEQPIRRGGALHGRQRVAVPAVALVALLAATVVVTADPPTDPLAALEDAERAGTAPPPTTAPPQVPGIDRPLRLLVVGDDATTEVVDAIQDEDVEVETVPTPPCGPTVTATSAGSVTCTSWIDAWTPALEAHDPDVVLLMPAHWNADELEAAHGPAGATTLPATTADTKPSAGDLAADPAVYEVLEGAVDLLASDGATVAIAEYPHPLAAGLLPDVPAPEQQVLAALHDIGLSHPDAHLVATADELPVAGSPGWVEATTSTITPAILELGATVPDTGLRVMVVGDSVGWFVGRGLERSTRDGGDLVVWNAGTLGCGVARGGELVLSTGPTAVDPTCDRWPERWAEQVADFDPHVVVMLTGLWDLADRKRPEWDGFHHVGEPIADEYLVSEYRAAADVLTAGGAQLVWLTTPCYSETIFPGPLAETDALRPERTQWLNAEVLPQVASPSVDVVDLAGFVCPDGTFTQTFAGLEATRPDGVHFSDEAAAAIADWLVPQLPEPSDAAGG
jgi:peptidoglycan/LPS O-acetylase OafA/YrhL